MQTQYAIEAKYRRLFDEASYAANGKAELKPEHEAMRKQLHMASAGWKALGGVFELPESEFAEPESLALANAAMAMVKDPEIKEMALLDFAIGAVHSDKPSAWQFCMDNGLDPAKGAHIGTDGGYVWRATGAPESSAWIAKAIRRESWKIAEYLAKRPEGKLGVPGMEREAQPAPPSEAFASEPGKRRRISKAELDEMDAFWVRDMAQWHMANHPSLMGWARETAGEKKWPAALDKALAAGGFAPLWGRAPFDMAAAVLALRGSKGALAGCLARGVPASVALGASEDFRDGDDEDDLGFGSDLAWRGGILGEKDAAASWLAVSKWIDQESAGRSARMVEALAVSNVEEWSTARYPGEDFEKRQLPKCLAFLEALSPSADKLGGMVVSLQGSVIALREEPRRKGASLARVEKLLAKWSELAKPAGEKRRILKA